MSNSRLFHFSMLALAALCVAVLALMVAPAAPVLAGVAPPAPTNCGAVSTYCNTNCPGPYCTGGSNALCVDFYNASLQCLAPIGSCTVDGRVNQNCSAPEIVYCDEDEIDFYYYNYFTGKGEFDFSIDTADLLKSVAVKTLIKQDGAVKVYLNPNGTVLMLAPQTDGKIYYMIFDPYECASLREGAEWGLK